MRRAYLFYFDPYTHIFDEFYEYLEQSIQTGDLCEIEEQFTKVRNQVGMCVVMDVLDHADVYLCS